MNWQRMFSGAAGLVAAAVLAGCASGTQVVLLPQDDGSPSAVVVSAKNGKSQRVAVPYQRATVTADSDAPPKLDSVEPAKVQADNPELFKLRPPAPQRFVLYFDEGGTALTTVSREELDAVVKAALARSGGDISITGYTDTVASLEQNDELSRRRADQIAGLLVERGFPRARIEAIGRGERELEVPTADEVSEPRNRRVVVEVR